MLSDSLNFPNHTYNLDQDTKANTVEVSSSTRVIKGSAAVSTLAPSPGSIDDYAFILRLDSRWEVVYERVKGYTPRSRQYSTLDFPEHKS
ncbi:hypothetical protein J6590_030223 [Homalodisca vitripennis]|nr:hypothetical protein J6590_030223 [Homalodisca vitripennis]